MTKLVWSPARIIALAAAMPACVFWDMDAWTSNNGYTAVVLGDQPLAYWPLDEGAGATRVIDLSRHGHDATVSGNVTLGIAGIGAGAAQFSDGKLDVGVAFDFDATAAYTLEAWVRPEGTAGDAQYRAIVSREGQTPARNGYDVWFQATPEPRIGFEHLIEGAETSVIAALASPDVVYLVATYDGATATIYVNGEQAGTKALMPPPAVDTHFLWGASAVFPANYFAGTLDELAVYGRVLDPQQIESHWDAGQAAAR